jgi:cell division protein ZapA
MADKPSLVHVEIFGQTYAVRVGADPGYVEQLAAYVDGQMKEVARSTSTVDSLRVAVLAALNVADELFRARQASSSVDDELEDRARLLADELTSALGE